MQENYLREKICNTHVVVTHRQLSKRSTALRHNGTAESFTQEFCLREISRGAAVLQQVVQ